MHSIQLAYSSDEQSESGSEIMDLNNEGDTIAETQPAAVSSIKQIPSFWVVSWDYKPI